MFSGLGSLQLDGFYNGLELIELPSERDAPLTQDDEQAAQPQAVEPIETVEVSSALDQVTVAEDQQETSSDLTPQDDFIVERITAETPQGETFLSRANGAITSKGISPVVAWSVAALIGGSIVLRVARKVGA